MIELLLGLLIEFLVGLLIELLIGLFTRLFIGQHIHIKALTNKQTNKSDTCRLLGLA